MLLQRKNEEAKSGIGAVRCAQMCRKYTPKGEMGYPKRQNGIPQMVVWGMRKRGLRASGQGCRGGVLGVQGLRNGGLSPRKTPKIVQKGEKGQSILQFSGRTKQHHL